MRELGSAAGHVCVQQPSYRIFLYSCRGWILSFLPWWCQRFSISKFHSVLLFIQGRDKMLLPSKGLWRKKDVVLASLVIRETGQVAVRVWLLQLTLAFHLGSWHHPVVSQLRYFNSAYSLWCNWGLRRGFSSSQKDLLWGRETLFRCILGAYCI